MKREPSTCCQLVATATKGLLNVDIPYPAAMSHFLFPILSENQPEKTLSRLAVDSAMPSIRPMTDLFTPRTLARNLSSPEKPDTLLELGAALGLERGDDPLQERLPSSGGAETAESNRI